MKIGLLSTLATNIGDDFIRQGLMNVLSSVSDGPHEFVVVNKHDPAGVYPAWHPVYWTRFLPKGRIRAAEALSVLLSGFGGSRFDRCDLIIQCGTPVYWRGCHHAEWAKVIWRDVLGRLSEKIKVVNLAAGSCYAWENRPAEIEDACDAEYIRAIYRCCRFTTVRDPLAHRLLTRLGLDTRLIPCSALLAGRHYRQTETADRVFVNYMKIGGHYEYNQNIDPARWHAVLKEALNELSARHRITFICHNQNEYQLAQTAFPEYEAVLPQSVEEYFETARTGIAGIFNRLHAGVAFAGLGIPSVAVGCDTRMLMVEQAGNPVLYVNDVSAGQLIAMIQSQIEDRRGHAERLLALSEKTFMEYRAVFTEIIGK